MYNGFQTFVDDDASNANAQYLCTPYHMVLNFLIMFKLENLIIGMLIRLMEKGKVGKQIKMQKRECEGDELATALKLLSRKHAKDASFHSHSW
jgi:hypothetical protein